ncbi:transmembrane protein [Thraustotheca clavata]|uniref:Transmembrane protein n=1 Tax=Thraustotheca clavata TaxID=74557 RepID=A0A1V9ZQI0_9STRA|nr:transmembrane protein [Thraustotheca clavata]
MNEHVIQIDSDSGEIVTATAHLLQTVQAIEATRQDIREHSGKAALQAQLDMIGPDKHTRINQVALSPYAKERKECLFHMQIRHLETPVQSYRYAEDNSAWILSPRPAKAHSPTRQATTPRKLLASELMVAKGKQNDERKRQQDNEHQVTKEVLRQSLRRLSARRDPENTSRLMQGRRESVHRLRCSVTKVTGLDISTCLVLNPQLHEEDQNDSNEEAPSLYKAVRVAHYARQLRKLSIEVQRQSINPNNIASSASIPNQSESIPRFILEQYTKVLATVKASSTKNLLKDISTQTVLSKDDFIKMLCLTLGFSNKEWAAKCYPVAYNQRVNTLDHSITLSDFAHVSKIFLHGSDMDKIKWVFEIYDRDDSGSVEIEEVFQTLHTDKEDLWDQIMFSQQLLGIIDHDYDGRMQFQEFVVACNKVPMFFNCFAGALPIRLSNHPKNIKLKLGLQLLRKLWTYGLESSAQVENMKRTSIDISGFITIISYIFRFARSNPIDQSLAHRLFKAIDVNGNSSIDFEEFIRGISKLLQGTLDERSKMMHFVLDLDGGGTISKLEIHTILVSRKNGLEIHEVKDLILEENVNEIMASFDENSDGSITYEEFQRAVRNFPHLLDAFQDLLFSGCRLDADFKSLDWLDQHSLDALLPLHHVVPHPNKILKEYHKVFSKAVKKVFTVNSWRPKQLDVWSDHCHLSFAKVIVMRAFVLLCVFIALATGLKQEWSFTDETRRQFLIERFGFSAGGQLEAELKVDSTSRLPQTSILIVHEDDLIEDAAAYFQQPYDSEVCILDLQEATNRLDFNVEKTWKIAHPIEQAGFYYLLFAHCGNDASISFTMKATMVNPNGNYLTFGDTYVPVIYLAMSLVFLTAALHWVRILHQNSGHIHSIHYMMGVLIFVKAISLFAESMRFYYMKAHGDTMTSWNEIYYVFMFLKGMMLFVVILLIGTGWSLLKPHLNNSEKQIITAVLILQVINNIAAVVLQETSIGTQSWILNHILYRDVMHLVDIICCCSILFPIVSSIRHLRQTADTDGKAHINLQKLTQFRSFYIAVVTYVYFTRIALYLLAASLPFNMTWISVFVGELAAFIFYGVTGWKFQPQPRNPYLALQTSVPLDEFGLDEDEDFNFTSAKA